MQVYLAVITTQQYHIIIDWKFPIHIKIWVHQSLWFLPAEHIHQGDVILSAFNKSFSRGAPHCHTVDQQWEWFWESYLLGLSLTALIAVTCLHELGKTEISDVHYRYETTICANTYIWFLLESLKSHLLLCYYSILLFDARHLLSGGFNRWNHTSLTLLSTKVTYKCFWVFC